MAKEGAKEAYPGGLKTSLTAVHRWPRSHCPSESLDILEGSFNGCTSLTSVTLPEGLQNCAYCFDDCTSLISVTMPPIFLCCSFFGCTSLTTFTVLGSGAFTENPLYSVEHPRHPSHWSGIFTGPAQIESQLNEMDYCGDERGAHILSPMDRPESG